LNRLLPWRVAAWALGVIPLAFAVKWTVQSRLGPNPVEFLEHFTGDWTLRLLLTTLAMTPLRKLTRMSEPIRIRRILGLWTYAFLCLHFSIYLVFDLGFSVLQLGADLVKRTYIALGFTAWLLLLPAAILGAIHYLWLVKADTREPLIYLAILLGLLAFRLPIAANVRVATKTESRGPSS
jgi:methionine sulfoxide reductase heme-binding subunit